MATGIIADSIQNTRTLPLAHSAAVEAGEIIVDNGTVLVAINKAAANEKNAYVYMGKCIFPKVAGTAANPGDKLYWDAAANNVTKTVSTNTRCGMCIEAASAADTTVVLMLLPAQGMAA
jgi:predicted RecA/RadA family phage recombinase